MPRLVHKATDAISETARQILCAGFAGKLTYRAIAKHLKEIGEEVPERTIARRAVEWRGEQARRQAAREQVMDLVEAMKAGHLDSAEMVRALATDALMGNPDAFRNSDPLQVQDRNLWAEELRLKRDKLALDQERHVLNQAKFRALQDREQRAIKAVDGLREKAASGEKLAPEDIDRIREIYGLRPTAAHEVKN